MDYPIRSVIRCHHDGNILGSVVVIRGDPMYDENHTLIGHKNRFLQIRLGQLKGKECRAIFNSLDDWYESLGVCRTTTILPFTLSCECFTPLTIILLSALSAVYLQGLFFKYFKA